MKKKNLKKKSNPIPAASLYLSIKQEDIGQIPVVPLKVEIQCISTRVWWVNVDSKGGDQSIYRCFWLDWGHKRPSCSQQGCVCMNKIAQIQSCGYSVKTKLLETTGWQESLTYIHSWLEKIISSQATFWVTYILLVRKESPLDCKEIKPVGNDWATELEEGEQARQEFMGPLLNARVWRGQRIIIAPYLAFLAHHHLFRLSFPITALSPIHRSSAEERETKFRTFQSYFFQIVLDYQDLIGSI